MENAFSGKTLNEMLSGTMRTVIGSFMPNSHISRQVGTARGKVPVVSSTRICVCSTNGVPAGEAKDRKSNGGATLAGVDTVLSQGRKLQADSMSAVLRSILSTRSQR